jgi:hypothetical protein
MAPAPPITLMSGEERETKTAASRIAGPDWPLCFFRVPIRSARDERLVREHP